jgi:outer membrane protein TolC
VERARVLSQSVQAAADAGLRPGADASRARAELALAETQAIQAAQAVAVAKAALAQLLGISATGLTAQPGPLLELPPDAPDAGAMLEKHPLAAAQNAAVEEGKARERALARSYFPRLTLLASVYGRGAGTAGPNVGNWAVGMNVTFPAFDLPSLRARREAEMRRELSEAAQYNRVLQDLHGELGKAQAQLDGARRIAANTPLQLEAARAAERQATARYKSGLGAIVEVAEAQRLLKQAETDDALAKLGVWRGLLAVAAAQGDLTPFLNQAGK